MNPKKIHAISKAEISVHHWLNFTASIIPFTWAKFCELTGCNRRDAPEREIP